MAPYMIHTSFQHELYRLDIPPVPNDYRQITSTSASTIDTDALRALEEEGEQPIIDLARNFLSGFSTSPDETSSSKTSQARVLAPLVLS